MNVQKLLSLFFLFVAFSLQASTVLNVTLEESIAYSDLILLGEVARMETIRQDDGEIVTMIHLFVEHTYKGNVPPGSVFVFERMGGTIGRITSVTHGEADYGLGERILVQLTNAEGPYRTLGFRLGKWAVHKNEKGEDILFRDLSGLTLVDPGATSHSASGSEPINYLYLHKFIESVHLVSAGGAE